MVLTTFSVRVDESLKRQFNALCLNFRMNVTTAFNVFARAVVREKGIPFEIQASGDFIRQSDIRAFIVFRIQAKESGVQDLSLGETSEEIHKSRYEEVTKWFTMR